MSTGWIILIVAVVALAAAAAALARRQTGGGHGLRRRFGPEYDRTVAQYGGDEQAAEKDLGERLHRHGKLRPRPLDDERRERYEAQWAQLQERFVLSPAEAVAATDRLIGSLLRDRGFPTGGYDEQVAALSVQEPRRVNAYREVHAVSGGGGGERGTEELRQTMLHARELIGSLLDGHGGTRHDGDGRGGDRRDDEERTGRTAPARRLVERMHVPWQGRHHHTEKGAAS
ncbi:hypothetical protein AB0M28_35635 [Streptomyces sp. NPDC051940]|uniref:hypothetical protein n=1 Tax=Streptomyces sp. NPDC051940 TaxID=3155675 RepID=UPI003432FDED